MNTVISEMMNTVKEQKVQHMKNIKRLTNEKALVTAQFKDCKDGNSKLKGLLDSNIQQYQVQYSTCVAVSLYASNNKYNLY